MSTALSQDDDGEIGYGDTDQVRSGGLGTERLPQEHQDRQDITKGPADNQESSAIDFNGFCHLGLHIGDRPTASMCKIGGIVIWGLSIVFCHALIVIRIDFVRSAILW